MDDALGVVDCCVAAAGERDREGGREVNIVLIVSST